MKQATDPKEKTPKDKAIEFASNSCFHQSLVLPETQKHGALRVTYALTTNFEADDLPALLYCSGMGAPRYMIYMLNHAAEKAGVRMIVVDRPGFGGSTPVPLDQRVDVWLETVPPLLEKLKLKHVALVSHSVGTIYLLNTILRLPEVLDPIWPYAAIQAPWVHPTQSDTGLLNLATKLPESWIGSMGSVQNFVGSNINFSSGMLESVSSMFRSETSAISESESKIMATYGMDKVTWAEVGRLQSLYFRSEDSSGPGQDSLLCLKKGGSSWGACDDYNDFVTALTAYHKAQQGPCFSVSERQKLKITVLFSETDIMVGKGGQEYFEKCWARDDVRAVLDFECVTIKDTNHDSVITPEKEGLGLILARFEDMTEV